MLRKISIICVVISLLFCLRYIPSYATVSKFKDKKMQEIRRDKFYQKQGRYRLSGKSIKKKI